MQTTFRVGVFLLFFLKSAVATDLEALRRVIQDSRHSPLFRIPAAEQYEKERRAQYQQNYSAKLEIAPLDMDALLLEMLQQERGEEGIKVILEFLADPKRYKEHFGTPSLALRAELLRHLKSTSSAVQEHLLRSAWILEPEKGVTGEDFFQLLAQTLWTAKFPEGANWFEGKDRGDPKALKAAEILLGGKDLDLLQRVAREGARTPEHLEGFRKSLFYGWGNVLHRSKVDAILLGLMEGFQETQDFDLKRQCVAAIGWMLYRFQDAQYWRYPSPSELPARQKLTAFFTALATDPETDVEILKTMTETYWIPSLVDSAMVLEKLPLQSVPHFRFLQRKLERDLADRQLLHYGQHLFPRTQRAAEIVSLFQSHQARVSLWTIGLEDRGNAQLLGMGLAQLLQAHLMLPESHPEVGQSLLKLISILRPNGEIQSLLRSIAREHPDFARENQQYVRGLHWRIRRALLPVSQQAWAFCVRLLVRGNDYP